MRLLRTSPLLGALLAAVLVCPSAQAANPLAGKRIFMDCQAGTEVTAPQYNPWYWFHHYQGRDATKANLIGKIAKVPAVKHFAGNSIRPSPTKIVDRWMARVDDPQLGGPNCDTPLAQGERDEYAGDYPVIAIRAMVHDRCRGWSGGEWNTTSPNGLYKRWIDAFVKSLGRTWDGPGRFKYRDSGPYPDSMFRTIDREATVIIEPDALALTGKRSRCLTSQGRRNRYALLTYAAKKLSEMPNVNTYMDVGASDWMTSPSEAVSLLKKAGVRYIRGFALNSNHFEYTRSEIRFGNAVAKRLKKHYVVNTAENANGPLPRRFWKNGSVKSKVCNPKNAGLGTQPTSNTGSPYADALLWVSRPGLSSNGKNGKAECGRGPLDNVWWEPHALELARQAGFKQPYWPPRPL
jgi:Glycosyl hydrolases family 6